MPSLCLPARHRRSQSCSSLPAGLTVLTLHSEVTVSAGCYKIPSPEADKQPSCCSATYVIDSNPRKKKKKSQDFSGQREGAREREQGLRGDSTTFLCRPQKSINEPSNSISVWRHRRHRGEGSTPCSVADTVHDLSSSLMHTQTLLFHPD